VKRSTNPRGRDTARYLVRLAIVASVLAAVLIVEFSSRSGVMWRLITFTYQANLLAAAFYLGTLASARVDARAGLRGAAVVYVVVAGLVWNLFLTGHSLGYTPANFLLHVVVPVLTVVEWLLVGPVQGYVRWWQPPVWLGYPAAYVIVALSVLNHAGRRTPYYFLDPGSVGAITVAANVGVLAAVFLGLGYALMALGRAGTTTSTDTG
jgi:hypothetical protein